mgnify:FL=1
MAKLVWHAAGTKQYELGVDRGVLYVKDSAGYGTGVAWNGLTAVNEAPSGGESTSQYADNIEYMSIISAEKFGATIEAFTYPNEFAECDGSKEARPGVFFGQQGRKGFGFAYRTLIGNDTEGQTAGYKIHLVYGASAKPSEKANATVNDSPEAATLSWEMTTIPEAVTGSEDLAPVATIVINSLTTSPTALAALEKVLYGDTGTEPRLPLPSEVLTLIPETP